MSAQFLILLIVICLTSVVLSSNPDSVIAQSSEDTTKKSAPLRNSENQDKLVDGSNTEKAIGLPVVRVLRPFVSGSRIIWKDVRIEGLERIRDRSPFFSVWSDLKRSRPNVPVASVNNSISGKPFNGNAFQRPQSTGDVNYGNLPQASDDKNVFDHASVASSVGVNGKPTSEAEDSTLNNRHNEDNPMDAQPNTNIQSRRLAGFGPVRGNNRSFSRNATNVWQRRNPPPQPQNISPPFSPGNRDSTSNKRVSPDSNLFSGIVNDFAFKLVENLNLESNFLISPLSIFIALSMCYLGSDGRTKAQLEQALGMNDNAVHGEHLHKGIQDLLSLVMSESSMHELLLANGMFLGKNFTVDPQFENNLKNFYSVELENLDFGNPQSSLQAINDWVARNTRNKISNLIGSPPPLLTRLILLNAIYFKGLWKTQFPVNLTYSGRFRSFDGSENTVQTMSLMDEQFPYYRSDEHRHSFIKLPYEGEEVSMIIALPYAETERPMPAMTDQILCHVKDAFVNTEMGNVAIPKFKQEFTSSLRRPLMQLGITDIFNRNVVNLSKLRKENDLYVSAILHKAVIEVNEEGTTASASTGVQFVPLSFKNTANFVANHPFAFYIMHEPSGLVLFYGKIFNLGTSSLASASNRRENVRFSPRPYNMAIRESPTTTRKPNRVRLHGAVNYEDRK